MAVPTGNYFALSYVLQIRTEKMRNLDTFLIEKKLP